MQKTRLNTQSSIWRMYEAARNHPLVQIRPKVLRFFFAAVFTALIGFLVFQKAEESEWGEFSLARLKELTDSETTVLVDFTADW